MLFHTFCLRFVLLNLIINRYLTFCSYIVEVPNIIWIHNPNDLRLLILARYKARHYFTQLMILLMGSFNASTFWVGIYPWGTVRLGRAKNDTVLRMMRRILSLLRR